MPAVFSRPSVCVPLAISLLDDQLTPVLAYRRLVAPDKRTAPSFLFESVEGGERQGRHSILSAQPIVEISAHGWRVRIEDHRSGRSEEMEVADPLKVPRELSTGLVLVRPDAPMSAALPKTFLGGWVGFAGYDTVRYAEPEKLSVERAPVDDRGLPDLHLAFYDQVVVFDHVDKLVHVVTLLIAPVDADDATLSRVYDAALERTRERCLTLQNAQRSMASGRMDRNVDRARPPLASNLSRDQHAAMVAKALEYIRAGDIFQVVLGQRFEKKSKADPFDVYRSLRAVNPSPYMVYLQARGCILVASSPEILCRVRGEKEAGGGEQEAERESSTFKVQSSNPDANGMRRVVTNRPLAGTRRRGRTVEEDKALEIDLLSDPKEVAEHVMLVDLGRNDVGHVAVPGSIQIPARLVVERYSHVMHISSTVTGTLRPELDCWDALRAALPVGTISGAPKIRAMQIIDELEPVRRGPYGGGMGYVSIDGDMDIALALRTMVVPTSAPFRNEATGEWTYHLQASGGIVADSETEAEYQETVNKAAASGRAIEVADRAFEQEMHVPSSEAEVN
jgi:anthranilate synthase component 1